MLDKSTLGKLMELKLDDLGGIILRQASVPEYSCMPFDQRFQFAIDELHSLSRIHYASGWSPMQR